MVNIEINKDSARTLQVQISCMSPVVKATFMVKANPDDLDALALLTKSTGTSFGSMILSASGLSIADFYFLETDLVGLAEDTPFFYFIKVFETDQHAYLCEDPTTFATGGLFIVRAAGISATS